MIFKMLITAFFCLLSSINAHQDGAPTSVCQSMMPDHGAAAQNDSVPYSIFISPAYYSSGSTVTVTLNQVTAKFKGYILEMRRMDNQTIIGGFSATTGVKLLSCDGQNNAAVTHTDNEDKTSVTFTWTAPAQSVGPLKVVATVVQNKTTFWTKVESNDLVVFPSSSSTTTAGCVLGILGAVAITVLIL